MDYQVACACHKVHRVTTGDAGSSLKCSCGRTVEVPSLSVLRNQAGEIGGSPELLIETMLHYGELPQDSICVQCHVETDNIRQFSVVCETPDIKGHSKGWLYLIFLFFGWALALTYINEKYNTQTHGRFVHFRLPVRICHICDSKRTAADSMALLSHVPVYEHLFKKYPHANITAV